VEFDNFKASKPETEEFTAIPHPDDLPPPEEEKRPSFFDLFKPRDN